MSPVQPTMDYKVKSNENETTTEVFAGNNQDTETMNNTQPTQPAQPDEINGPRGKEPTRYGDWEKKGRCSDF